MKKIFLVLFLLPGLVSCIPTRKFSEKEERLFAIDFTPYTESGFYISPEKPNFEYKPIGIVNYTFLPFSAYAPTEIENPNYNPLNSDFGNEFLTRTVWIQSPIIMEECLDTIVNMCKNMGADGLYNFKVDKYTKDISGVTNPTTIVGIEINGFAIRRYE
jgi:hypothetical protein